MGKGGASVGKFVKGMGINESDIEPGDFPTRLIEKDGNTKDTETPSFVEEIKQMMALRKERQLEIESTIEAISPTAVFSRLIEEMKEISRVNYLNEAEQKMRELREQYSRWGEIQNGAVGDLQEMSRVFLIRHNHIDYQISELLRLFQRNTLKCTRELTMVKEKMVKELAQESDQIRLAALKLTEDDKKSIEKLQRRSHEAASIAETEFMQAREIAKDQERLTTLRLTLRSQLESCEEEFAGRHADYVNSNEDRTAEFIAMMERDTVISGNIAKSEIKQMQLKKQCESARVDLVSYKQVGRERNEGLKSEISKMQRFVSTLRRSLQSESRTRSQYLLAMILKGKQVTSRFQTQVSQCERILKLHQMAHINGLSDVKNERLELFQLRQEKDRQEAIRANLRAHLSRLTGIAPEVKTLLLVNGHNI